MIRTRTAGRLTCLAMALLLCAAALCVPVYAAPSIQPTDNFYVYDGANVLSDATEKAIVNKNIALQQACGAQIVVASINGSEGVTLEQYTYEVASAWGIGDKQKNNGVLLMLDIQNQDYQCMQGSGLESSLPTPTLSRILQEELEPDFAAGDYDAGALKTFDALCSEVASIYKVDLSAAGIAGATGQQSATNHYNGGYGNDNYYYGGNKTEESSGGFGFFSAILFLIVILVVIVAISSVLRPRRYGRSNSILPFLLGVGCRPHRRSYYSNPFGYGARPPH
ncbi:MAG: TPM domain-containing protein, partial [Ruthenibacterium sp.]